MKTSVELDQIRQSLRHNIALRSTKSSPAQVIVGMGEDGISAGARDVVQAVSEELRKHQIDNVVLLQKDYIDQNGWAPVMWIDRNDGDIAICARMTPEKVPAALRDHLPEYFA